MKENYKLLVILMSAFIFIGCSEKSFSMQSYADKWFNDKHPQTAQEIQVDKEQEKEIDLIEPKGQHNFDEEPKTEQDMNIASKNKASDKLQEKDVVTTSSSHIDNTKTNASLKTGAGASIVWSSTYKRDEKTKGQGAAQKSLDTWTKEEWEPKFKGDANQTKADKEANKHFTLQHYVDKIENYMNKKELQEAGKPKEPANYEKMNKLPVIGK